MTIVTRFAPSPTGFLHIGGARTALYNFLYARHMGGRFLLRIEDTDRARHNEAAVAAIRSGLQWLGLAWDEEFLQSDGFARHAAEAERLVEEGKAYYCHSTQDEMAALKSEHPQRRAVSPWRTRAAARVEQDSTAVIRVLTPDAGQTAIDDLVQGRVVLQNTDIDDFVLLRADGTPTYMHAVVVDDNDCGVNTIIRGDDHLVNGVRHRLLYEALGYELPNFAHIPLIHGEDGAKLSKRHGALGVEHYAEQGYLPAAICNWLLRMGWGQGDREFFTVAEAQELFDIREVSKAPARLDIKKLDSYNCHYLRTLWHEAPAQLLQELRGRTSELPPQDDVLRAAVELCLERHTTLASLIAEIISLFAVPAHPLLDPKANKALHEFADADCTACVDALVALDDWSAEAIKAKLKELADELAEGKFGKIARPLRAAVLGRMDSPDLARTMAVLGKTNVMARLNH